MQIQWFMRMSKVLSGPIRKDFRRKSRPSRTQLTGGSHQGTKETLTYRQSLKQGLSPSERDDETTDTDGV